MKAKLWIILGVVIALAASPAHAALSTALTNLDFDDGVDGDLVIGWIEGGSDNLIVQDGSTMTEDTAPRALRIQQTGLVGSIGNTSYAYQSMGTVAAGDNGTIFELTAKGGGRYAPVGGTQGQRANTFQWTIGLYSGTTGASVGTLLGSSASKSYDSTVAAVEDLSAAIASIGTASWTVDTGATSVGTEVFVVVEGEVLTDLDAASSWTNYQMFADTVGLTIVPEPVTLALLGIGGLGMLIGRRRR